MRTVTIKRFPAKIRPSEPRALMHPYQTNKNKDPDDYNAPTR